MPPQHLVGAHTPIPIGLNSHDIPTASIDPTRFARRPVNSKVVLPAHVVAIAGC